MWRFVRRTEGWSQRGFLYGDMVDEVFSRLGKVISTCRVSKERIGTSRTKFQRFHLVESSLYFVNDINVCVIVRVKDFVSLERSL